MSSTSDVDLFELGLFHLLENLRVRHGGRVFASVVVGSGDLSSLGEWLEPQVLSKARFDGETRSLVMYVLNDERSKWALDLELDKLVGVDGSRARVGKIPESLKDPNWPVLIGGLYRITQKDMDVGGCG